MQLQDLENYCLSQLQQPGVNFGGAPSWGALTNPSFDQPTVDFAINQGYQRLMSDLSDLEIFEVNFTIASTPNTYIYSLTPPGLNPPIAQLMRVFYAPVGLQYTWEFRPGYDLMSWPEYQKITANGYNQTAYAFGTIPQYVTMYPDRSKLYFFPGSANSGDVITVLYTTVPAAGTSVPLLVNETDTPVLPADSHEAIATWALGILWNKARVWQAAQTYRQMYKQELDRVRAVYDMAHRGDTTQFDLVGWQSSPYPMSRMMGFGW